MKDLIQDKETVKKQFIFLIYSIGETGVK